MSIEIENLHVGDKLTFGRWMKEERRRIYECEVIGVYLKHGYARIRYTDENGKTLTRNVRPTQLIGDRKEKPVEEETLTPPSPVIQRAKREKLR